MTPMNINLYPSPRLVKAGTALTKARKAEAEARTKVRAIVLEEAALGVPETRLATAAGVDRLTVRAWKGVDRVAKRV